MVMRRLLTAERVSISSDDHLCPQYTLLNMFLTWISDPIVRMQIGTYHAANINPEMQTTVISNRVFRIEMWCRLEGQNTALLPWGQLHQKCRHTAHALNMLMHKMIHHSTWLENRKHWRSLAGPLSRLPYPQPDKQQGIFDRGDFLDGNVTTGHL